jgi:formyltetrahydrofolate hydrolase
MLKALRPLRVALLCSRRAPGLSDLLGDEDRGSLYELVCAMTSESALGEAGLLERAGVPLHLHPLREACRRRGVPLGDLGYRREYDAETLSLLAPHRPDVLALSSYLFILTDPVLESYPERIVNVHGSDLTSRDGAGRPRYVGLRSVRDAIFAGERATRATAHLVTGVLDDGPILARSGPFPVSPMVADAVVDGAVDLLKAYAYAHQEWMLRRAWGPLLKAALARIALAGAWAKAQGEGRAERRAAAGGSLP